MDAKPLGMLAIRVDSSPVTGAGHLMRCLALAEEWAGRHGTVTFLTTEIDEITARQIRERGFSILTVDGARGSQQDAAATCAAIIRAGAAWIVVDGYDFSSDYQKRVRLTPVRLAIIDDYGHGSPYSADVVINPNPFPNLEPYATRGDKIKLLAGARYALLRKEFRDALESRSEPPKRARKVLVTMGGSDTDGVALEILKAIQPLRPDTQLRVLVGPNCPWQAEIKAISSPQDEVIVAPTDMRSHMDWADIAISAGGVTLLELIKMRVPTVAVVIAENQRRGTEELSRAGAILDAGWHADLTAGAILTAVRELLTSVTLRKALVAAGSQLIDGKGAARVVSNMTRPAVRLREATISDREQIWQWSNEPVARSASHTMDPISWEAHVRWFDEQLTNRKKRIYVALDPEDEAIGMIRFAPDNGGVVVSLNIDQRFRGKSLAHTMIKQAAATFLKIGDCESITAYVKVGNERSLRAFLRSGFEQISVVNHSGQDTHALILRRGKRDET